MAAAPDRRRSPDGLPIPQQAALTPVRSVPPWLRSPLQMGPLPSLPATLLVLAEWLGGRAGRTLRRVAVNLVDDPAALDGPRVARLPLRLKALFELGRRHNALEPLLEAETAMAELRRDRRGEILGRLLSPTVALMAALLFLFAMQLAIASKGLLSSFEVVEETMSVWGMERGSTLAHLALQGLARGVALTAIALFVGVAVIAWSLLATPSSKAAALHQRAMRFVPGMRTALSNDRRAELAAFTAAFLSRGVPADAAFAAAGELATVVGGRKLGQTIATAIGRGASLDEAFVEAGLADWASDLPASPDPQTLAEWFRERAESHRLLAILAVEAFLLWLVPIVTVAAGIVTFLVLVLVFLPLLLLVQAFGMWF